MGKRAWKLWDKVISQKYYRKQSDKGYYSDNVAYYDLNGYYSGRDTVTYVYTIDGYPEGLVWDYRNLLRRECLPGARIQFFSILNPYTINWDSHQMKSKLKIWRRIEDETDDVDEYNLHANMSTIDTQFRRRESLVYLNDADIRRKRQMFRYYTVVYITGKRGETFDMTVKGVLSVARKLDLRLTPVTVELPDYLSSFSPFSLKTTSAVLKGVGNTVLSDELIARFNTYSTGVLGVRGIYWGSDIFNKSISLKPIKVNYDDAEILLVTAETQGGKTYFVKTLVLQFLADTKVRGTIMDIKNSEYKNIGKFIANEEVVTHINMGEGEGAYADAMAIVCVGDKSIDSGMFSFSKSFTLAFLKALMQYTPSSQGNDWVDMVLDEAIARTYLEAGVTEDPKTWELSHSLRYEDVYATVKRFMVDPEAKQAITAKFTKSLYEQEKGEGVGGGDNDVSRLISTNRDYQYAVDYIIAKLSTFFEVGGTRRHYLEKSLTLQALARAKLVICDFGLGSKSSSLVDPVMMSIMQLTSAMISYIRSKFARKDGMLNFKLWEEFQEWGKYEGSREMVSTSITQGRVDGDINMIITNKVSDLLEDDKFQLFSNVTSIAVGRIKDARVREALVERLSIPEMLPELDRIANANKQGGDGTYTLGDTYAMDPYWKAFLIGIDLYKYKVVRMEVPESIGRTKLYKS